MLKERIIVATGWRLNNCCVNFEIDFNNEVNMEVVYEAMANAIEGKEGAYKELFLHDLEDSCKGRQIDVWTALGYEAYTEFIPEVLKAAAAASPDTNFEGRAVFDDTRCYYIHTFNFNYEDGVLTIEETIVDDECGYFCPDCGSFVAYIYDDLESEMECEDCETMIAAEELIKKDATENTFIYKIR